MKRVLMIAFLGLCSMVGGSLMMLPLRYVNLANAQSQGRQDLTRNDLEKLGNLFETIAARVSPAVVAVEAAYPARTQDANAAANRVVEESGSGFVIAVPGYSGRYVVTNNHVVAYARADQITLRLNDGKIIRPERVWTDPETDIALLGLPKSAENIAAAPLGNSDSARVGQWVLAIGSPFGLNQTVTHGIVSARERGEVSLGSTIRIKDFLQTDAAINPGSSGGPLVDMRGEIIGINTAIASHSGTNSGVAFSIPINLVKRITRQLLENGTVSRGYLGMQLARSFEPADALRLGLDRVQGAWVERVYPETPASEAGLRVNDVVLKVEDVSIRNENHLINLISKLPAGQRVRLYVWRQQQMITLPAVIGDWNAAQSRFQSK